MSDEAKAAKTATTPGKLNCVAKPYLAPFSVAVRQLGLDSTDLPETLTISKDQLRGLLTVLLKGVAFDPDWYLTKYPDIADAVSKGVVPSARVHFVEHGYVEGRLSGPVTVDEQWYLAQNPDIAESIEVGEAKSCQDHFEIHGRAEGRAPFKF
ncbi:hypothetical protein K9U39_09830 [Rhodoblastus acidophilus]|uniref:Uncharacterized protein n=1 Tax=Candidatus Rhodoblastus alkanivorans TaxID=2954117 RepID=A0ABS9Z8Y0_9HYPH|nr:hypothetical protein [Candidatus Rhodoblastus alkanivorans]MCI4679470.1 hypothetical protein [Candidatus Rhodoblastus alkanivorans]MCI4683915.1 hypothetical protein [Candidatus Rhodoblastus alkanivorans]MDI4641234.1 hypothetical protein [Rhodoblastus acidophilus]